jgi:chromate transporter
MRQRDIFMAFLRVGLLGYGGGPSSIPLVYKEVVEKYKWLNADHFSDILALGNALPGPVATKMAGYIGFRIGGIVGMINALIATVLPTAFLMIILLTSLNAFKDQAWVKGMTEAVIPVVAVMLAVLTWGFIKRSGHSKLGWTWTLLFIFGSFLLLEVFQFHPAILILALFIGAFVKGDSSAGKVEKEQNKQ